MSKTVASWRAYTVEVAVVSAAAALAFAPLRATWIESRYSTSVYPQLERAITPISNRVPFALLDLLLVGLLIALTIKLAHTVRHAWRTRSLGRLGQNLLHLATASAAVYILFLLL